MKVPTIDEQIKFVEDLQKGYPLAVRREMLEGIHDSLVTTRVILREQPGNTLREFRPETKGKGAEL